MATARRQGFYCTTVLLACAFLALPSLAGKKKLEPYAVIFSTVFDANHRGVPGIKVKIARLNGEKIGKTWEGISDVRGEFAQRVPAGAADYLVWVEIKPAKGAPPKPRPEAKVHVENEERQDVSLHLTP